MYGEEEEEEEEEKRRRKTIKSELYFYVSMFRENLTT